MTTDTKKRIIESAILVFKENLSAPLQAVADEAGVTRRTLHRYFKDREELVKVCRQSIEVSCRKAMIAAIQSSEEALVQLENMLYAGIHCGSKYALFFKGHQQENHQHTHENKNCADYDYIYQAFHRIIHQLQQEGKVNPKMSSEWIQVLHSGMVETSVNAQELHHQELEEAKQLAWLSFRKAISP